MPLTFKLRSVSCLSDGEKLLGRTTTPTRRVDMRRVREIMRLHKEAGLPTRQIAQRTRVAASTMREMPMCVPGRSPA